ncbi:MAG: RNA pyrophosphohydrolase [Legionellales bacterium]|nr:RNA pyrophosphohydrolase [Legionellales bacterium]
MIDENGYRANVGIILVNEQKKLFWGRRIGQDAWQFPQGGIHENETAEDAMYRELFEEVGLRRHDVEIIGVTAEWLTYDLPHRLIRHHTKPVCVGQKQKWFLLKLVSCVDNIDLSASGSPEFDDWCWVNYWYPLREVISFKRKVYKDALQAFTQYVFPEKKMRNPKQNLRSGIRPRRRQHSDGFMPHTDVNHSDDDA